MNYLKGVFALLFVFAIASCGSDSASSKSGGKNLSELKDLSGGKYAGGIFKMNEEEYFRSLYPPNITEVTGSRIGNQIYEGLVRFDQADLTIKPCLAKSWEISDDQLTYTFKLRDNVVFHDDKCFADGKGRKFTAKDVKYCFDRWASFDVNNKGYDFIKNRIKGSADFYEASKTGNLPEGGCAGVKVLDDYTVQIELEQPVGFLLDIFALSFGSIYPEEAVKTYGDDMRIKTVGTGPFILSNLRENDVAILTRNENYWDKDAAGNQLPYLNGIRWSFVGDQKSNLLAFKQGKLDMLYRLPLEMVEDVLTPDDQLKGDYTEFQYQESPCMVTQYYGFKNMGELFNNVKLRQAFSYAVDREKIVRYTVKGAGVPGHYGVVPPAIAGYEAKEVPGYKYNPEKARKLMAEAGYPNGKGFPDIELQINSGGGRNEQVAEAIQKMINETLNIKVSITKMPFAQHLEAIETSKTEFWRAGWVADFPDPENFLGLLYGKHIPAKMSERSYLNSTRYNNSRYDDLFDKAMKAKTREERFSTYFEMDKLAMSEAPWLVLFYTKDRRLLQGDVRDYPQNAMEYRLMREVYFVPE